MRNSIVPSCVMVGIICFVVTSSLWATGFPPKIPQYPLGGMGLPITGDFNGDGKLDLLVLSPCNPEPCSTPSIAVTLVMETDTSSAQSSLAQHPRALGTLVCRWLAISTVTTSWT